MENKLTYRRVRLVRVSDDQTIGFAAKELAKYLRKADPELYVDELLQEEVPGFAKCLYLAVDEGLKEEMDLADPALDDAIDICVKNDEGYIKGSNPRSVLIGVYRFLKEIGFAFTRPGKDGERTPAQLPESYEVRVKEKPACRHRGFCIEGADAYENIAEIIDFIPKAGMNEYFVQFWVPGTFFDRWYFHEANPKFEREELTREQVEGFVRSLEEEIVRRGICYHKTGHGWTCEPFGIEGTTWDAKRVYNIPEESRNYLAEVNGKRELWGNVPLNTNLCYSNQEVRDKITDAITEYSLKNQQVDVIHFWLADGHNNHCECENCRKMRPSDWYVRMLNELDEKMTAAGSKTRIVFLIYVDLLWEPVVERLKNPDRFILMFAPITRRYGVNYSDSPDYTGELTPYVRNRLKMPADLSENVARLKKWQEQFKGDSFIYDYHLQWAHVVDPGYELSAKNMYEDMCYLHDLGLDGNVSCQVQRALFPSGAVVNALAKALWDPSKPFEEVEESYYCDVYGEDGPTVHAYLAGISALFNLYPHVKEPGDFKGMNVPQAEIEKAVDAFLPTIEAGIAKGGEAKKDWEGLRLHADYVKKVAKIYELRDNGGKPEEVQAAADEMYDYIRGKELQLQRVLDVQNTVRVWPGWGRIPAASDMK